MTRSWATFGIDLQLDLREQQRGDGVRIDLERALREAIQAGRLAGGSRLPSSRSLAVDLGLARNTVAEAYGQLVAEGWLEARQGAGTWVAERAQPVAVESNAISRSSARPPRFDLQPGAPDVSAFPRARWSSTARRVLAEAPSEAFGYGDPRGRIELRSALAGYLGRVRGVRSDPAQMIICSGFTQAFGLVAQVLAGLGATRIGTEPFGLPALPAIIAAHRLDQATVPVDDSGARFGSELDGAGALLLSPAHQFPLGLALAPQRRRDAVSWAQTADAMIVEDDYDGEFRYDRQPIPALQGMAPDQVLYIGTASKSLAPALRLAWLVAPPHLVDRLVEAKELADRQGASLQELILAAFIESGDYDRQVRRMRLIYRRRRDHVRSVLQRDHPTLPITGISAGLHLMVDLPPGTSEESIIERARTRDLALEGLHSYAFAAPGAAPTEDRGPALIVGYGRPPQHAFTAAVARLSATLADTTNRG